MPVHKAKKGGKSGYKYGKSGKFYAGKAGKKKAMKQAYAIKKSGYKGS